MLPANR